MKFQGYSIPFTLLCFTLLAACSQSRAPKTETAPMLTAMRDLHTNGILKGEAVVDGSDIESHTVGLIDVGRGASCTGVIVGPKQILTAAHCTTGKVGDLAVTFGGKMDQDVFAIRVTSVYLSSFYSKLKLKNKQDLALIVLEHEVPLGYSPVELVNKTGVIADGELLLVAGFGIYRMNPGEGSGILRATIVPVADAHFSETEFLGDQTDGHGVCGGDSGGPAYVLRHDKIYLAGITSRGSENCDLAIFTNTLFIDEFLTAVSQYGLGR